MRRIFFFLAVCDMLGGCAELKLKEGGLAIGKDTTASLDEGTVARVTNQF